jgi:chromosome segregation ATPase
MVSNLHLLEVMQILRTTINKVRNDQERIGKTIGEWVSYLKKEVLERNAKTNFLKDEIRQSRIELCRVKAEMGEVKEELVEVREELAKVVASLRSTSTSIEQSQQAQAQAHAQVQAQVEAQVEAQVQAQVEAQVQAQVQAQAQAQQEKRSFAAVAAHALGTPAQAPNRERGVTLNLGKAAATLRGKPLATIKDMA